MSIALAVVALQGAVATALPASPTDATDIVVTARKRTKCDVRIADRVISDAEFRARAAEWAAGAWVRIVAPTQADYRCLARIAFRLGDYGVTRIVFVEPR